MKTQIDNSIKKEFLEKKKLGLDIKQYYSNKTKDLNLESFDRIKSYFETDSSFSDFHFRRNIVFSHLNFEQIAANIIQGKEFTVVSGLNPSSSLHLGHKVLFDILLFLQKLGATIYIPITNDESYLDGKVSSLKESSRLAYEEIIPSIIAFGFNPQKTKIYVDSDYPDLYNFAIHISKNLTNKYVETVFGEKSFDNAGKSFYRSAVQLAQILLPQLKEFDGSKNTLIPVGIDQHPYLLLARDVAKKMKFIPPSELIIKFQNSLKNPFEKMSGSKPETAIFLNDTEEVIKEKINKAFTGSVSSLIGHQKFGAVPEACSVFSLLYFHHPDDKFISDIYKQYKKGKISTVELKEITMKFVTKLVKDHQEAKRKVVNIKEFILKEPLRSFL